MPEREGDPALVAGSPARRAETLLAFDFGARRIGVAVGNTLTGGASPVAIVEAGDDAARFARIGRLIDEWRPDRFVVGRPVHSDGQPLPVTVRCERFARQLGGRFRRPVHLVDESYSSTAARALDDDARAGHLGGRRGRASVDDEDAASAAILLQQWLDHPTPAIP